MGEEGVRLLPIQWVISLSNYFDGIGFQAVADQVYSPGTLTLIRERYTSQGSMVLDGLFLLGGCRCIYSRNEVIGLQKSPNVLENFWITEVTVSAAIIGVRPKYHDLNGLKSDFLGDERLRL
ncbi:hypothetical protein K493DRAFT_306727 [Basidiobolus meristosporus CBS 931.73]|uniref:Uncharacterized protein n=1 Tax=Basidiobolus meristosporus CBS 931.73 TaxID=1314790 RepID=A0A1Y1XRH2_9FUNG|nr:hypothetical protein K493DRAFT_306727 [Basidiobolus meristosporus CBS 931.73]|eukprot:ORX88337.1 hypothetical protein K493DRAFT_306727 [Basidiobolus meristosporus CBS 931.73]